MSLILNGLTPTDVDATAANRLFNGKTFDDIGVDQELTEHLQRTFDPDGSKYGGDVQKLKDGFLNDMTSRKSGIVSSAWDWAKSTSESSDQRQESNLAERLYDSAPNRLFSADSTMSQRAQALGAGVRGGLLGQYGEELALNILLSPVAVAKWGFQGLKTAARGATLAAGLEKAAGGVAARELTEHLTTGAAFEAGEREALEAAVKKEAWRSVAKRSAAWEAGSNAVLGGVGGALEADAKQNRGFEDQSTLGGAVEGAVMGGLFGGIVGGATAIPGARSAARELVGETAGRELRAAGVQTLPERAAGIRAGREAEEAEARAAAQAAAANQPTPPDTATRDGALDLATDLREMQSHVQQIAQEAGYDRAASRFSRETLGLMSDTLARSSDVDDMAARLMSEADALSVEGAKPDAVACARTG